MSYTPASEKAFDFDKHHGSEHAVEGQQHDRTLLSKSDINSMSAQNTVSDEITVTQRMVSATVGSVLTSLLGMPR